MNFARPKSQTLTYMLSSISTLWLLISLCTIPNACIYSNTIAVSRAILILSFASILNYCFFMCSRSNREPYWTCSKTIYISGIVGITPIRIAMLGCRRILVITISFWISAKSSSVNRGSNIFLIATGVPLSFPLWIVEKPPWPIWSPNSMSLRVTSLTPGTGGSLPAYIETF